MVTMMKKTNMNIALCKEYDEKTQSAKYFVNRVDLETNRANLTIFIMLNGINDDSKELKYDFFIKCVEGTDEEYSGVVTYLFSMNANRIEKTEEENCIRRNKPSSDFENVYQIITSFSKSTFFPCGGKFQIEAYCVPSECEEIKKPMERYKYCFDKYGPSAIYDFIVND